MLGNWTDDSHARFLPLLGRGHRDDAALFFGNRGVTEFQLSDSDVKPIDDEYMHDEPPRTFLLLHLKTASNARSGSCYFNRILIKDQSKVETNIRRFA